MSCIQCGKPLNHSFRVLERCLPCHESAIFAKPNPKWRTNRNDSTRGIGQTFTAQQRRIFHNIFSGLQVGYAKDQIMHFITLTTQYEQLGYFDKVLKLRVVNTLEDYLFNEKKRKEALKKAEKLLNNDFQIWKKRICRDIQRRRFDQWFFNCFPDCNLGTKEGRKQYRKSKSEPVKESGTWKRRYDTKQFVFKLCYFKVRTVEGGGVIHALTRSTISYFDKAYITRIWEQIHGANQVKIEEVGEKVQGENKLAQARNAAFYVCGKYINDQPTVRQSSSHNWIFLGAMGVWRRGKKVLGIKKELVTTEPRSFIKKVGFIFADTGPPEYVTTYFTHKEKKPNVNMDRPSLIKRFMETRKSLRKDTGYSNALYYWLQLTRNPPKNTRQVKLATIKQGTLTLRY